MEERERSYTNAGYECDVRRVKAAVAISFSGLVYTFVLRKLAQLI